MAAYYNEIDPFAAAWLRELIKNKHIADGEVDERDIRDVGWRELDGFDQCHFFAGIGAWSYALRLAGWPDDRPVWTGSCPCQPFSAAGRRAGLADDRHLWPAWEWLISQCRPGVVLGEQVASKDGLAWLDIVLSDLEAAGYAAGAVDFCAAGVGAPHIRQRLWFVADTSCTGGRRHSGTVSRAQGKSTGERCRVGHQPYEFVADGGVGEPDDAGPQPGQQAAAPARHGSAALATSGWRDVEWIACRDGKSRPTQPGIFPLAHGTPARVGRLRGYGNAIVAAAAKEVIDAYLDVRG